MLSRRALEAARATLAKQAAAASYASTRTMGGHALDPAQTPLQQQVGAPEGVWAAGRCRERGTKCWTTWGVRRLCWGPLGDWGCHSQ